MSTSYTRLPRDIFAIDGADNRDFLQGLVSQNMDRVREDMSAYSAFLTPQGKYLHDFIVMQSGTQLWIDCEAGRAEDFIQRLSRFRLRADVQFEPLEDHVVFAVFGNGAPTKLGLVEDPGATRPMGETLAFVDPRNGAIGCRIVGPRVEVERVLSDAGIPEAAFEKYDALRISLELPDGSRDMDIEKSTLLESNFDELNGIDWEKGCYMGQELTARTKYRGLVKRRLSAYRATDDAQAPGDVVTQGDRKVGEIRSRGGDHLLVSVRLDALESGDSPLSAAGSPLEPV